MTRQYGPTPCCATFHYLGCHGVLRELCLSKKSASFRQHGSLMLPCARAGKLIVMGHEATAFLEQFRQADPLKSGRRAPTLEPLPKDPGRGPDSPRQFWERAELPDGGSDYSTFRVP